MIDFNDSNYNYALGLESALMSMFPRDKTSKRRAWKTIANRSSSCKFTIRKEIRIQKGDMSSQSKE